MELAKIARQIVNEKNTFAHDRDGLLICPVKDAPEGIATAKAVLDATIDRKTALFLSGGSTPRPLYEQIAKEETLQPGVVGLIDERYGEFMHEKSNEKMIAQTGLVRYLSMRDILYYAMLRGLPIEETTARYDELLRSLQAVYPKSIGILGIGNDGHTAGIAPNRSDFQNQIFSDRYSLVAWFDDPAGSFKKRVTMTFLGLSMLDVLIILAFGAEKEHTLQQMFEAEKEEKVPARFFLRKDIAPKTILITDCHTI